MNKHEDLRILFLGTPEFAAESLSRLVESGARIVGVVTAPDKPAGRGLKVQESAVKKVALEFGLPLFQPEKLRDPAFLESIQALKPDLGIVVAFRMLPEMVWNLPRLGTFNLHASLLPAYRGAAPIHHALLNGETETGVTTFFLRHEIDTGDLLFQEKEPIFPEDNLGSLYTRLQKKGAELVCKTVRNIQSGDIHPFPQDEKKVSYAPKIHPETCRIDPTRSARTIHNQVRGLSPSPGAFVETPKGKVKIFASALGADACVGTRPGTFRRQPDFVLQMATGDFWLTIEALQPEGKKRMTSREYLIGHTPEQLNP